MVLWLWMSAALAESWCAAPLTVHEWGVQVLRTDGVKPEAVPLPGWFHRDAPDHVASVQAVRDLPRDTGMRALPVVQAWAPRVWGGPIPFALEVGFTDGEPSVWYPQVDRAPTRRLAWDALSLEREAPASLEPAEQPWVQRLREVDDALWFGRGGEHDRFLFYEADTTEKPDLRIERGDQGRPGLPHLVLRNVSDWTVHDVVIVADGRAWTAPAIPSGATAGLLLEEPLDRDALRQWLRDRWAGPDRGEWRMSLDDCVMMRDPAVPLVASAGHRLYGAEVDVLLSVWADRLLASEGVHLVYREDPAALDARMPLSVYTDMYHYPELRRLGVVIVEGLSLP